MGFFSWNMADTNKPIRNVHTANGTKNFYLLIPKGKGENIKISSYDGYGNFNGSSWEEWIYLLNEENIAIPKEIKKGLTIEQKERIGGFISGEVSRDINTGEMFDFHKPLGGFGVQPFTGNYGTIQKGYTQSPNELLACGAWEKIRGAEIALTDPSKFNGLKFSMKKTAIYEDLPKSTDADCQGFF